MTAPSHLLITAGEPAGIGPDIVIQLAQQAHQSVLVVIADADLLQQRANALKLPLTIENFTGQELLPSGAGKLYVWHTPLGTGSKPGKLNKQNAPYVLETLRLATDACLENKFDALVTGPIHKGIINDAGIPFTGHTEFLAALSGCKKPVMMLATEGLRVALATTHMPLADVSKNITPELLEESLIILDRDLKNRFGINHPAITVCGLNPHAGEDGHLGREEIDIIQPVMKKLSAKGMNLTGPVPADTAFTLTLMQRTDAFLTMYHDQGLPVLKHMGFNKAVNITLGLPFIRTSVDHGTAIDLAGTGHAKPDSLYAAIKIAQQMCSSKTSFDDK